MRIATPRLRPLADDELDARQEALIAPFRAERRDYNIFRTFAHHPVALKAFLPWGGHVLSEHNTLSPRQREILILRTGWLCRAGYEWSRHVPIGRRAGLDDPEIDALKVGADAANWSEAEQALIRAADALTADQFLGDAEWEALVRHFDERQRMDVVFTVGQYVMVSMFLNSAGVQLDPDVALDADWEARA